MHQFALASVYPRSIVWLVRLDEWDRFEEIVQYNCAMVGGYFNVIVPLTDQDSISEEYQRFLVDYDPDLVVLAPGMTVAQQNVLPVDIHPFGVVPWESVSQIAILDPWAGGTGVNATLGFMEEKNFSYAFVAIADDTKPDISRLSLVACGDVALYGSEHKENFLQGLLKDDIDKNHTKHVRFETLPSRYELAKVVAGEYLFPLAETIKIFDTCIRMQHHPDIYRSLVGLTASYAKYTRVLMSTSYNAKPSMVILVSEKFGMKEATSFWNLRAGGTYTTWVSFSVLESKLDEVAQWLNSEYIAMVLAISSGSDIIFSTSQEELPRLQYVVEIIQENKQAQTPFWRSASYEDITYYHYDKPCILEEQVIVAGTASHFTFIPELSEENTRGECTTVLRWNSFMLPYCPSKFIQSHISSETVSRLARAKAIILPRFRVTKDRYLAIQNMSTKPIEFNKPTVSQIINALFADGGFTHLEQSSAAKYHTNFINRCGNLADTAYYLATSPYYELFEVLADNTDTNKKGFLLKHPDERRALHHLHLRDVLDEPTPAETKQYFNIKPEKQLPIEAFWLLEKGLLERGFQLSCTSCSYKSWYPAEHVGQTFECSRCFQKQVYNTNPLWLYKLPEVIFQGFKDNMQVPLLALDYLRRASKHSFEWVPDSNIYTQQEDNKEAYRNIDILCISDGKLYIGEAKSNDTIDADQFSFYEQVCRSVAIDGIVFATSQPHWNRGTQQRIDVLKTWFTGEVIIVTGKELYTGVESNR